MCIRDSLFNRVDRDTIIIKSNKTKQEITAKFSQFRPGYDPEKFNFDDLKKMLSFNLPKVLSFDVRTDSIIISKRKKHQSCLLYTSPSPRDLSTSRMPSSA
eukprot:TRINITY_DN24754_c0_g1_i3.p1 TRINITY_DN24754_c0_g1~~TRINITY_DN24754_c0_g1_i3.p1  ORF type:complete len:101 (-),score=18.71 TRINITY_DN24754_c0_g1_i3:67-369(-)